jgi:hypothetical protein
MATQVVTGSVEGGQKLDRYLRDLAVRLGSGGEAKIGFLEGATYPQDQGGLPVAQVAFWNNYGTVRAPPRPFFTHMIEEQAPTWARKLGMAARYSGYRTRGALEIVAADIKGHLVESINLLEDPPLAAYTVEKKGFPKPLIDKGVMVRSVAWVVTTGQPAKQQP